MAIGDWIIIPGPGSLVALVTVALGIITTLIGAILFKLRTRAVGMALKQLRQDLPSARVVARRRYKDGIKEFVELEIDDGAKIVYSINKQDEVATRLRNP